MATTARQIGAMFGDDGQRWRTDDGRELDNVCREYGAQSPDADYHRSGEHGARRYRFTDGSTIIATDGGWDFGLPGASDDCWCWAGANDGQHNDGCPDADEEV